MTDKVVVFSTCASEEEAARIARHLVERGVAACVTITPGLRSIYRWRGAIEDTAEFGLTIKTRRNLLAALERELRQIHSYETPELLAIPVVYGADAYLDWIDRELPAQGE